MMRFTVKFGTFWVEFGDPKPGEFPGEHLVTFHLEKRF